MKKLAHGLTRQHSIRTRVLLVESSTREPADCALPVKTYHFLKYNRWCFSAYNQSFHLPLSSFSPAQDQDPSSLPRSVILRKGGGSHLQDPVHGLPEAEGSLDTGWRGARREQSLPCGDRGETCHSHHQGCGEVGRWSLSPAAGERPWHGLRSHQDCHQWCVSVTYYQKSGINSLLNLIFSKKNFKTFI